MHGRCRYTRARGRRSSRSRSTCGACSKRARATSCAASLEGLQVLGFDPKKVCVLRARCVLSGTKLTRSVLVKVHPKVFEWSWSLLRLRCCDVDDRLTQLCWRCERSRKSTKDMTNFYVDVMHTLYIPIHYPIYLQLSSETISKASHRTTRRLQSNDSSEWPTIYHELV